METSASTALPLQQALEVLWGDDQRPLLVLRECNDCVGSDIAMLRATANNERTRLLANWFRIVRLPPHVLGRHHPFHNVFAAYGFERELPHFFLLAEPKAEPVAFTGRQLPSDLHEGMHRVLRERYVSDPKKAVQRWQRLLGEFDMVEAQKRRLRRELAEARAETGPKSSRARRLQRGLDDADEQMKQLLEREKRIRNLVLRPFGTAKAAAGR